MLLICRQYMGSFFSQCGDGEDGGSGPITLIPGTWKLFPDKRVPRHFETNFIIMVS